MSGVHVQIDLDAPVERVWEIVMDPSRLKDWVTIHRSVRDVSDHPLRRGSTMDQALHLFGVPFHVHWTVVAIRAPNHAEWEGRGPAHSRAGISYDLTPKGDNATVFKYTNDFMPPGGRLGVVASRVLVGSASEREAHNSLARLKQLVEQG
jgi:uncharacterized membrane protein